MRRTFRCALVIAAFVGLSTSALADGAAAPAGPGEWNFQVTLDGKPIGSHRFTVVSDPSAPAGLFSGTVRSVADFKVRLLGITVYRYQHEASATWRNGCLQELSADTNDNGSNHRVRARPQGDGLRVAVGSEPDAAVNTLPGCVLDYAYWSPSIREQASLLDPQSGQVDVITVTPLGTRSIKVHGAEVAAKGWRIKPARGPIDVWYAESDGRWVGLDSEVKGGRHLSYRLP